MASERSKTKNVIKSQKGVALLMALVSLSLLMFIAIEVGYDSTVDYVVARQQVDRISAYYAAKSGVKLSLLRLQIFKQQMQQLGPMIQQQPELRSQLDLIWSFPLMWPMPSELPGVKTTEMDQDMIKDATEESIMVGQYTTQISAEGGKIAINALGDPSCGNNQNPPPPNAPPNICQQTYEAVLKVFKSELEQNEKFRRKFSSFRFEELVNNIQDYIDADSFSKNSSDESSAYRDIPDRDTKMPPNHPLRTLDELHQVAGMTDELYKILAPRVSIYGDPGINVNYANKDVLMSLDPSMTELAADKAISRRNNPKEGGPFRDPGSFLDFIKQFGVDTNRIVQSGIKLRTEEPYNFRIVSTGLSSNVKREITIITYDNPKFFEDLVKTLDTDDKRPETPKRNFTNLPAQQPTTVVSWEEN